jgi:hypothetical protein
MLKKALFRILNWWDGMELSVTENNIDRLEEQRRYYGRGIFDLDREEIEVALENEEKTRETILKRLKRRQVKCEQIAVH